MTDKLSLCPFCGGKPEAEPVGYVTKNEFTQLRLGASCVDLFGKVVPTGFEMVPLYAHPPKPEATEGGAHEKGIVLLQSMRGIVDTGHGTLSIIGAARMSETPREYLIKKGSYFYRHDCAGYTSFKFDAGRYTKERAEQEASIEPWHMEAIHQDDVPNDTAPDKAISDLTQELNRLREVLEFYANPEIYKPHPNGPAFDRRDLSFHARAALAATEAEERKP